MVSTFVHREGEKPFEERYPEFLRELGRLSQKHNIYLGGHVVAYSGGGFEYGYEVYALIDKGNQRFSKEGNPIVPPQKESLWTKLFGRKQQEPPPQKGEIKSAVLYVLIE